MVSFLLTNVQQQLASRTLDCAIVIPIFVCFQIVLKSTIITIVVAPYNLKENLIFFDSPKTQSHPLAKIPDTQHKTETQAIRYTTNTIVHTTWSIVVTFNIISYFFGTSVLSQKFRLEENEKKSTRINVTHSHKVDWKRFEPCVLFIFVFCSLIGCEDRSR